MTAIHTIIGMPVMATSRSLALLAKVAETMTMRKMTRISMGYLVSFPRYFVMSDVTDDPSLRMDIMPVI